LRRFVCIHSHFYQPPRENPWTGRVEEEESARPFHDWNERIASECYVPNAVSPLLDERGRIAQLVNNYGWISFDFGPTLIRWVESHYPELYGSIIDADRSSLKRFGGHGSAMAQVYNHMIMPLADPKDKRTQVQWGVEDFERRFGRRPEGMWLPETAVDLDTLETLAEADIRFTILSPNQASATRNAGEEDWTDVSGGRVDPRRAYACSLQSGRTIALFFYDESLSTKIAFGNLLESRDAFPDALLRGFSGSDSDEPQLVNVASDGETYGHHRKHGNAALSHCLSRIDGSKLASITNYGQFLSLTPPTHEVRIVERTSWSCPHGVERWRSNCGCGAEIRPGYSQEWRAPLRSSMDWLRGRLADIYDREGGKVFIDPRTSANEFASIADNAAALRKYILGHSRPRLSVEKKEKGIRLLRMLECSALMFASCGWFWEDISRIESVQVLRYAARGMELATELTGVDLEPEFMRMLATASSNEARFRTGSQVYLALAKAPKGERVTVGDRETTVSPETDAREGTV
jgi:alpha-amylase/alpha-mannosidase (GH57 family)